MVKIKIVNNSHNPLPKYATENSSGVDLYADFSDLDEDLMFGTFFDNVNRSITITPGGRVLIPTNIKTAIPEGYEIQIRSRSGLALKNGVFVLNSPGTIDSDFRNSWGIILMNLGEDSFDVYHGDRIAQAVLVKVEKIEWEEVKDLDNTDRGLGGFGSTGK